MATRFYFRDTTAAEPKPNFKQNSATIVQWLTTTLGGGQDTSGTTYPCDMSTTPGASNATIGTSLTEGGTAHYVWVKQFISPALAAQTITGTFALVNDFNEGAVAHNMNPSLYIYVWKADDSGVRGVLWGIGTSTLEADITNGSLQTFTFASYTLTSLAISTGDRIVIELMAYDNNTKTAAYNHIVGLNGAVASGYESYIEFSQTLNFPSTTYSQTKDSQSRFLKVGSANKASQSRFLKTQSGTKASQSRFLKTGLSLTKASQSTFAAGATTYSQTKGSRSVFWGMLSFAKASRSTFIKTVALTKGSLSRMMKTGSLTKASQSRFLKLRNPTLASQSDFKGTIAMTKSSQSYLGTYMGGNPKTHVGWLEVYQ